MKTKKTKKILGGVAIAAVSLGCLGLAGIANADPASTNAGAGNGAMQSADYPFSSAHASGAISGSQTLTFNTSAAQSSEPLKDHILSYVQIGSYYATGSSRFQVVSTSQAAANAIGAWASANGGTASGDLVPAAYANSDGDPLTWLVAGANGVSYLGADLSGQAGGTQEEAVRSLANYLYGNLGSSATKINDSNSKTAGQLSDITTASNGMQTGTWTAPAPGIYLIIDSDANGNASMPMIVATEPGGTWSVPASMTSLVTNEIALKTQDPLSTPFKQFVVDGKLSSTADTASVGSANTVEYQVAGVFPNFAGYPSYTYSFVDNPGTGMTLNINKGQNLDIAGIPVSTLMQDTATSAGGSGVNVSETYTLQGKLTTFTADSPSLLASNITNMDGGSGAQLKVTLNQAALNELETLKAKSTTTTVGDEINNGDALTGYTVGAPTSDPQGQNGGKNSWTGQTSPTQYFGMTYQAYLNNGVATSMVDNMPVTEADNTASVINNGTSSTPTGNVPLKTSGTYNGGDKNQSGKPGQTNQTSPDDITGSPTGTTTPEKTGTGSMGTNGQPNPDTTGVPNKDAVGAGISWMKITASGQALPGATFYVQNSAGDYLYATGEGWAWTSNKKDAEIFSGTKLASGTAQDAEGALFQISGLGNGTYTVTEAEQPTGYASILPSFDITVAAGSPETVTPVNGYNLINSTLDGSPFSSKDFNTVENVKRMSSLPLTGGAGVLTGVIAAVLLFGTAGIVLVVYKRKKSQQED